MRGDPPEERDPGYGRAPDWGPRCGCLAAGLVGLQVAGLLVLGVTFGDCMPEVPCHAHDGPRMLAALAVGVGVGFAVLIGVRAAAVRMPPRFAAALFFAALAAAALLFWRQSI